MNVRDIDVALCSLQMRIVTGRIGRVVSYVDATGRATVQLLRRPRDRRGLPILQPPIPGVPVLWPGIGGQLAIRGTLMPGDDVLLVALDRDHSPYFATGAPFDAASERMHDLSDVVAVPVSFRTPPGTLPGTIRIGGPGAVLGNVAGTPAAAAALTAAIDALAALAIPPLGTALTPVPADPSGTAAAAALNAIILTLLPLLRTLSVSNVVLTE